MSKAKKGPSITKTLISLIQSDPSNRTCADCRSALVDPSAVCASFCPNVEELERAEDHHEVSIAFHDFALTHRAFTPPDVIHDPAKFAADPALTVNQRFGGHGLFVCTKCAEAHKILGAPVTKVLAVQDAASWTQEEARFMKHSGGNARSWTIYEAYMPEPWKTRRPNPTSSLDDRIMFCKAKYEALAFAMPPPGPLSELAWSSILERNEMGKKFASGGLKNIHGLSPSFLSSPSKRNDGIRSSISSALPNRLIDYFCVVSTTMQLHPQELVKDLSKVSSPEGLHFWPQVADCYPTLDVHTDMKFPGHLPSFVLPNGCSPSKTQQTPTFFTFVLTLGDGDRLYGGALQIHDEPMELEELTTAIVSSGYEGDLPGFLGQADGDDDKDGDSDIVFFPKCLVLLSHYPYFDLFRESLLQLYRITLVEAPLPIERYIANLTSEVPLPPQGKVRVEFGFTTEKIIRIERPPVNKLPLANFSYRPLFASLSVGNIMTVLGCLMEECQVALLSQHYSILTPVAEALLSALFPLSWQGLYIPVIPYAMLDILDAPVPFIVGLDSRYLAEMPIKHRPKNVVFVDLDRDVVYLGIDEVTGKKRAVPCLPPRDALKLRSALEEYGGSVYLLPNSGIKGCIMEGAKKLLLKPNADRPKYAQMENVILDAESLCREEVLSRTKKAYDENELSEEIAGFRTIHGHMKDQGGDDSDSSVGNGQKTTPRKTPRKNPFRRNKEVEMISSSLSARGQAHLLDMNDPDGFSSTDIRNVFLRFMVTTFANYGKFLIENKPSKLFDEARFLRDLGEEPEPTAFVGRMLKTQMFQRFLEERLEDPDHPEIRLFDESILAKLNRSRMSKMAKGGKLPTLFLDDESGKITKTFTPAPPSNRGLPDSTQGYQYNNFPPFESSLVGRVRFPMLWPEKQTHSKRFRSMRNTKVRKTQQDIVKRAMKPLMAPAIIAAAARRSARDLESALSVLKERHWEKSSRGKRSSSKKKDGQPESDRVPKTTGSSTSIDSDRKAKALSRAETIMLNARRKQSILLELVVKLQATCRMFMARKRFASSRRAVICLQRKFHDAPTPKPNEDKLSFKLVHILAIQRDARRFLAHKMVLKSRKAVGTLQRNVRGHLTQRRFARLKTSTLMVQKHIKGRRDRYVFQLLKTMVTKVQAQVRGIQVRKQVNELFHLKMAVYRGEIVTLWQLAYVSLSLRTKLWPVFSSGRGFARLRLAESELSRIWTLLGMNMDPERAKVSDVTTMKGEAIGVDNTIYCLCKQSSASTNDSKLPESLPSSLRQAYELVEAERLQTHERLDAESHEKDIASLYQKFGIPNNEKMKKVALAKSIWFSLKVAGISQVAMIKLFPELHGSCNIVFQPPSSKSKRRFPGAAVEVSSILVDRSLWDEISLEGRVKRCVQEVTSIYITKVPSLMAKLEEADKRRGDPWKSMGIAIGKDPGSRRLTKQQRVMIRSYLDAAASSSRQTSPSLQSQRRPGSSTPVKKALQPDSAQTPIDTAQFPDLDMEGLKERADGAQFPEIEMHSDATS